MAGKEITSIMEFIHQILTVLLITNIENTFGDSKCSVIQMA